MVAECFSSSSSSDLFLDSALFDAVVVVAIVAIVVVAAEVDKGCWRSPSSAAAELVVMVVVMTSSPVAGSFPDLLFLGLVISVGVVAGGAVASTISTALVEEVAVCLDLRRSFLSFFACSFSIGVAVDSP